MRRYLLAFILSALIAPLSSSQPQGLPTDLDIGLENIPVRMRLGNGFDNPIALPSEPIRLTVESVAIKGGETIQKSLYNNGIEPDVESFTLVYLLNPGLERLEPLPAASRINLPKADGAAKFQAALQKSYRVFLTTNPETKDHFARRVNELRVLRDWISKAEGAFENDEIGKMAHAFIDSIDKDLKNILLGILRRNGRPITKEPLEQLCSEIELINKILYEAISGKKKIGGREKEILQLVKEDISIKQNADIEIKSGEPPKPWPRVKVTLNAISSNNKVAPIRFMYVHAALDGIEAPRPFPTLSSPSSVELTEAMYFFWGVKPDSLITPITEKLKYSIVGNQQGEITIELSMKH